MRLLIGLFILGIGNVLGLLENRSNLHMKFKEWMTKNRKIYDTDLEYRYRFAIFAENVANIEELKYNKYNYILSINSFADLTIDEMNAKFDL